MALTQSAAYEDVRTSYGGSDPTMPSFLRPYYNRYNSVGKSLDLGPAESLIAEVAGQIGSQAGSSTLFFKVTLPERADLQVVKRDTGSFTDRYVSVGVLDVDRKPVPIDAAGFAYENDRYDTPANESFLGIPAGVYYVTVSSSQWQAIPYAITINVIRYVALTGAVSAAAPLVARLAMAKLSGTATATAPSVGAIVDPGLIRNLAGVATAQAEPTFALTIMRGEAVGTMTPTGRLKMTWKLAGAAAGSDQSYATLSSEAPYGGGYGY